MATLQKFKLLATQCAVAGSPTRSPTTSPVIHLRRRKTLRMLLSRSGSGRRLPPRRENVERSTDREVDSPEKAKEMAAVSRKLKDLFVSSPSPPFEGRRVTQSVREGFLPATRRAGGGGGSGGPVRQVRPFSATFRQQLLRRAWRPMLVTIPE